MSFGCRGGSSADLAALKVGQGAFPGIAQSSARRKKQSSQVVARRFVIESRRATIGAHSPGLKGVLHQNVAISAKNVDRVFGSGN
jgi:hypothetical protein